jgi:hypothetical protein
VTINNSRLSLAGSTGCGNPPQQTIIDLCHVLVNSLGNSQDQSNVLTRTAHDVRSEVSRPIQPFSTAAAAPSSPARMVASRTEREEIIAEIVD